jgi:hypothetical protein
MQPTQANTATQYQPPVSVTGQLMSVSGNILSVTGKAVYFVATMYGLHDITGQGVAVVEGLPNVMNKGADAFPAKDTVATGVTSAAYRVLVVGGGIAAGVTLRKAGDWLADIRNIQWVQSKLGTE